jgi:hypothetical protein
MQYLKWDEAEINGLARVGITVLFTEVDDGGVVLREVGLDSHKKVVHKFPHPDFPVGGRGFFDNEIVSVTNSSAGKIPAEEFLAAWDSHS